MAIHVAGALTPSGLARQMASEMVRNLAQGSGLHTHARRARWPLSRPHIRGGLDA